MTADSTARQSVITRGQCYLLLTAAVLTALLITLGGVVCVTESGGGCPDWPGCYGRLVPPLQVKAIIEYLHRFVAALTSPLILAAAVVSWRQSRAVRWVSRPPAAAIVFLIAVIIFGAVAVLRGLPPGLAAVDLGSALIVLTLMVAATVVAFARRATPTLPDRLNYRGPFARLTLWTVGAVYVVLVSGVLVAGKGSLTRCLGWPLWRLLPVDLPGWPQAARLAAAGAASLLILAVVVQAWRTQRRQAAILRAALLAGGLFLAEMLMEAIMLTGGQTIFWLVLYVVAAAGLWAALVVLAVLAGLLEAQLDPAGP